MIDWLLSKTYNPLDAIWLAATAISFHSGRCVQAILIAVTGVLIVSVLEVIHSSKSKA